MDLRENLVVCIGSPMIDVTARVRYDLLQKYKLKPNNATSYNKDCSRIFEDLEEYGPKLSVGGSITNTVMSAQSVLPSPHTICYLGLTGKDDFDLGASAFLREEFLEKNDIKTVVNQAKYFYLSAFFLRISYGVIRKICKHVSEKRKVLIFNIGAPFLCQQYTKEFEEILPYVNVLIGNEEESKQLANALNYNISNDTRDIALFLLNQCKATGNATRDTLVIITRGNRSIIVASKQRSIEFHVPSLQMKFNLNTSGAGDYFVGGFLANYIQSRPIQDCIQAGIALSFKLIKEKTLEID
ncbi:hypothetical protein Trydic_g3322 [Trypoxylus dichotomus]